MMIKVFQTKRGKDRGNCLAACISTVTSIPIEDIPNIETFFSFTLPISDIEGYTESAVWPLVLSDFLYNHGFLWREAFSSEFDNTKKEWVSPEKDAPYIVIGRNYSGTANHAVIYMNGTLYHDPYSEDARGLSSIISVQRICTL